jgi:glycosyltransferase involved in cell wall biosynthesis
MRIVLWGTYDTDKPRIRILRDGLRSLGIEVIEIHTSIWEDIRDKSTLRLSRKWAARTLRILAAYPRLLWRYVRAPAHDLVLVSYPGQIDILVLRLFAWLRRKPVVFDWFISAYDTTVLDRHLMGIHNPLAWALWMGEWLSVHAADLSFMDTATHARRMERLFRLAPNTLGHVWVGAEEPFFRFAASGSRRQNRMIRVLFYGQFIPLHGISTIIHAARITRRDPIAWTIIGRGQDAPAIRNILEQDPLPNLEWIDWVPYEDLPDRIAHADVCLGIFGTSDKAASVIPNKVFQGIAAGSQVITRDSEAIRELPPQLRANISLVPPGDAAALADTVLRFHSGNLSRTADHVEHPAAVNAHAVAGQFKDMILRLPKLWQAKTRAK